MSADRDLSAWLADLAAFSAGHLRLVCGCGSEHEARHDALMERKREILARIEAAEAAR